MKFDRSKQSLIGKEVILRPSYVGYFDNLKGNTMTIKEVLYNDTKVMVTLNEIEEIHLIGIDSFILKELI